MTLVTAILQSAHQIRRALRKDNLALKHNRVTRKVDRFLRFDIDQVRQMLANGALAVFVERGRGPKSASIRQWTEAGIEMVKTRIDQLDRDDETSQHVGDGPVRLDVRTKLVSAKKRFTAEESI